MARSISWLGDGCAAQSCLEAYGKGPGGVFRLQSSSSGSPLVSTFDAAPEGPGDDDDEDTEGVGNIDPDDDEGVDSDYDEDEDEDTLWAAGSPSRSPPKRA